jgi:beta-lactamase superfamily II metal-dependent hydrolase
LALGKSKRDILKAAGYDKALTDPAEFYKAKWGTGEIFRYIQTHPDLDHMRGLKRLRDEGILIRNFWDTDNGETKPDLSDDDKPEWEEYQRIRKSTTAPPTILRLFRDAQNKYWNQDDSGGKGDGIHVLAPTPELRDAANEGKDVNAHSYVIRIDFAGKSVVLGGDATEAVWESIHKHWGQKLKCDVLKAAHHGRDSGYHRATVEAMSPQVVIVSVGKKPETDASSNYRQYSGSVWSTRYYGNLTLLIANDGQMNWTCQYAQ